ncbi:hypothetical protein HDU96_010147 [Phlyctochytrium bullatum]|nr:hypothetical protein HDU96_010147 [Phlyctochytrium bullatum]
MAVPLKGRKNNSALPATTGSGEQQGVGQVVSVENSKVSEQVVANGGGDVVAASTCSEGASGSLPTALASATSSLDLLASLALGVLDVKDASVTKDNVNGQPSPAISAVPIPVESVQEPTAKAGFWDSKEAEKFEDAVAAFENGAIKPVVAVKEAEAPPQVPTTSTSAGAAFDEWLDGIDQAVESACQELIPTTADPKAQEASAARTPTAARPPRPKPPPIQLSFKLKSKMRKEAAAPSTLAPAPLSARFSAELGATPMEDVEVGTSKGNKAWDWTELHEELSKIEFSNSTPNTPAPPQAPALALPPPTSTGGAPSTPVSSGTQHRFKPATVKSTNRASRKSKTKPAPASSSSSVPTPMQGVLSTCTPASGDDDDTWMDDVEEDRIAIQFADSCPTPSLSFRLTQQKVVVACPPAAEDEDAWMDDVEEERQAIESATQNLDVEMAEFEAAQFIDDPMDWEPTPPTPCWTPGLGNPFLSLKATRSTPAPLTSPSPIAGADFKFCDDTRGGGVGPTYSSSKNDMLAVKTDPADAVLRTLRGIDAANEGGRGAYMKGAVGGAAAQMVRIGTTLVGDCVWALGGFGDACVVAALAVAATRIGLWSDDYEEERPWEILMGLGVGAGMERLEAREDWRSPNMDPESHFGGDVDLQRWRCVPSEKCGAEVEKVGGDAGRYGVEGVQSVLGLVEEAGAESVI